ncbi:MAG: DUF4129 domain-containing protein [Pseudonocardia sp.]|nr:DUF4129 domain-containing protein [Pseudonocardia sp.]
MPPPPAAQQPAPPPPGAAPAPEQPAPGAEDPAATGSGSALPTVLTVLAVLVALAVLGALPLLLRRRQQQRRTGLARAGGEGAAAAAWAEVLAVSRDHGVAPRPGDTVRTTAEHIGDGHDLDDPTRRSLNELSDRVEAAWYGGMLPEPGMLERLVADVSAGITAAGTPLTARLLPPSVLPAPRQSPDTEPAERSL